MGILVDFIKFKKARDMEEISKLRQELAVAIKRMGEPESEPYYIKEYDDRADLVNRVIDFVISQRGDRDGYSAWVIDSSDL
jgi:hypothetical protein